MLQQPQKVSQIDDLHGVVVPPDARLKEWKGRVSVQHGQGFCD